jgi:hypothetical protein
VWESPHYSAVTRGGCGALVRPTRHEFLEFDVAIACGVRHLEIEQAWACDTSPSRASNKEFFPVDEPIAVQVALPLHAALEDLCRPGGSWPIDLDRCDYELAKAAGYLRDQLCSVVLNADVWQRTPAASC